MAKFPVEYNHEDSDSVVDAVNYLLSGPSNLGQYFTGTNAYVSAELTGNFRPPYATVPVVKNGCLGASGSTTIYVGDVAGILTGMTVTGTGVAAGATVSTASYDTITVSAANTAPVSGTLAFNDQNPTPLYVAPIALGAGVRVDDYTRTFTFAAAQPSPPFQVGNSIAITGSSIAGWNINYRNPGVIDCTTTTVTVRAVNASSAAGPSAGGTTVWSQTVPAPAAGVVPQPDLWTRTGQDVTALVYGPLDTVFVAGQLTNEFDITVAATADIKYSVAINRYEAYANSNPQFTNFLYGSPTTIVQRDYEYSGLAVGTHTLGPEETIFGTVVDQPGTGNYLYRIEIVWRVLNTGGSAEVVASRVADRNLTAQVIKQ